ncbi:MAG: hypothetical protein Q4P34_03340 [Tissierellia bacterium]|nr:hypothetical protein [Tissierellia bacterium]
MNKRKFAFLILIISFGILVSCQISNKENSEISNDESKEIVGMPPKKTEVIEVEEDYFKKPVKSFMPGEYVIEDSNLDEGIYDIHIKGAGKLSITDESYNLVAEESYPNLSSPKDYFLRTSLNNGYIMNIGNGLVVDIYHAKPIEDDMSIELSTGYWLIDEELPAGNYSISLKNVYGDKSFISIYEDGKLIDIYYFVKNDDNDSEFSLKLEDNQLIVISGISKVVLNQQI